VASPRSIVDTESPLVTPNPKHIRAFADAAQFERWLAAHHDSESELWLKIHKQGSGLATVSYKEALDVALCWGWIDGLKKSFDERSFLQRFTPRRTKSIWSQINREHVARLCAEGRMQPVGMAQVTAAQADGRWERAYAPIRSKSLPPELLAAIEAEPKALATLATLDSTNRFALGFRFGNLKTAAARQRKLTEFVAMLARGETLFPMAAPRAGKTKAPADPGAPARARVQKRAGRRTPE
jgi:uncharacterized protein YdeI (YjbR/CyaY-like superfamily)